jgi:hypothetical protein
LAKAYLLLACIRQQKWAGATKPGKRKKPVFSLNNCGGTDYQLIVALQKSGQLRRNRGKTKNGRGNSLEIGAEPKTIGASP